jgi:drug/metabolite transporter (DMT)-like permease
LFAVNIAGLTMIAPAAAVEILFFQAPRWTLFNLGAVLYIGVFASFLAYICWNRGVELVGANRAGFTTHLLPAFTALLAVIFLGEELHPYHIVGIAVVLFGVYLATSARRKAVAIAVD